MHCFDEFSLPRFLIKQTYKTSVVLQNFFLALAQTQNIDFRYKVIVLSCHLLTPFSHVPSDFYKVIPKPQKDTRKIGFDPPRGSNDPYSVIR